jgi:hypothetical protein
MRRDVHDRNEGNELDTSVCGGWLRACAGPRLPMSGSELARRGGGRRACGH